ncbi:MAG TPA: hypothetical protein VN778_00545 [Verrucomicrobiae bacterium]|nr:hypothetical protein [Verrucomicrobiae bacterium]
MKRRLFYVALAGYMVTSYLDVRLLQLSSLTLGENVLRGVGVVILALLWLASVLILSAISLRAWLKWLGSGHLGSRTQMFSRVGVLGLIGMALAYVAVSGLVSGDLPVWVYIADLLVPILFFGQAGKIYLKWRTVHATSKPNGPAPS